MAAAIAESSAPAPQVRNPDASVRAVGASDFIRGTTLVHPVLGSPIAQVKAPLLHNRQFASTGFDAFAVPDRRPQAWRQVVGSSSALTRKLYGANTIVPINLNPARIVVHEAAEGGRAIELGPDAPKFPPDVESVQQLH